MSGGQDNAYFRISTVTLTANRDWYPAGSTGKTAQSIMSAINGSFSGVLVATATNLNAVVYTTAVAVGITANSYATFTSSQVPLTLSPYTSSSVVTGFASGFFASGAAPSYSINSVSITIAGSAFALGTPVVYSSNTAVQLLPLVWGSTYYVIPNASSPSTFMLAAVSTDAVVGRGIVLKSSASKSTQDTFTLTPTATSGTSSLYWLVSNDAVHWATLTTTPFNVTVSPNPITVTTYVSTGTVNVVDFGHLDYGWLGISVLPPATSGAANMAVRLVGKSQ